MDAAGAVHHPFAYTPLPSLALAPRASLPNSFLVPTAAPPSIAWSDESTPVFTIPSALLAANPTVHHAYKQTSRTSNTSSSNISFCENGLPAWHGTPVPYTPRIFPLDTTAICQDVTSVAHGGLNTSTLVVQKQGIISSDDGWWEWILDAYHLPQREDACHIVFKLCQDFFTDPHIWLTALHPGLILGSLTNPSAFNPRVPHLILAILAHSTFHQSNNDIPIQMRALRFAEESKNIINHSLSLGGTEPSLAHAALILVMFEFQPHFLHSAERSNAALEFLIRAGKACWVLDLDKDVNRETLNTRSDGRDLGLADAPVEVTGDPEDDGGSDKWTVSPPWGDVSVEEIRREEMRRMCWTANSMTSSLSLWRSLVGQRWTIAPLNFDHSQVMYPGEALLRAQGHGPDSVKTPWALYHRSVALCQLAMSPGTSLPLTEAIKIQLEGIQRDLASLNPSRSSTYTWQAQNWLSVIRRRLGISKPEHVALWFERQLAWVQSFTDPSSVLPQPRNRPLYCWWFLMIGTSALGLVRIYPVNVLTAREVVLYCIQAVEEIIQRYPCEDLAKHLDQLRERSISLASIPMPMRDAHSV